MFKFLKDKLKKAVDKFSKDVDEASEDVPQEEIKEEVQPEQPPRVEEKEAPPEEKKGEEPAVEEPTVEEEPVKEEPEKEVVSEPVQEEKKGFLSKIKDKFTSKEESEEKKEVETAPEIQKVVEEPKVVEKPVKEKPKKVVKETPEVQKTPEPPKEQPVVKEEAPKKVEKKAEVKKPQQKEVPQEEPEEKKGLFGKLSDVVTKKSISESKFEELFWELEVILLENSVAVEVVEKIKEDLRDRLVNQKVRRGKTYEIIAESLSQSVDDLFSQEHVDLVSIAENKKEPLVIAFVGINGSGKTTTIAKLAHFFKKHDLGVVIAAGDTFRAAAIQQMEEHTNKLGIKLIKHDYGADPAAVAFDAVEYAKAHNLDVVMIDTAGRLHSNVNLMDEMKKIIRVANPDLKIFIGESIAGNDAVEQARNFNEAIGIDGVILCKADVDEKGGAAISVSFVTGKPILFLGSGQGYDDLKVFDKAIIKENLGLA